MQQDDSSSTYSAQMNTNPRFNEQEHLKCPRCDSSNTKFCYYNNYNLSQPRHFCKNCRRYWTKGGTLRNIPIGGGTRKSTKRSSNSNQRAAISPVMAAPPPPPAEPKPEPAGVFRFSNDQMEVNGGSFSSLLGSAPGGQFAKLLMDGLNPNMVGGSDDDGLIRNPIAEELESNFLRMNRKTNNQSENGGGEASCWDREENGWPDLSIYTPVYEI